MKEVRKRAAGHLWETVFQAERTASAKDPSLGVCVVSKAPDTDVADEDAGRVGGGQSLKRL